MENYTKYKLKSNEELASLLDGKDQLFLIACNKCFKEFETVDEPDCGELEKLARPKAGVMDLRVTGIPRVSSKCAFRLAGFKGAWPYQ